MGLPLYSLAFSYPRVEGEGLPESVYVQRALNDLRSWSSQIGAPYSPSFIDPAVQAEIEAARESFFRDYGVRSRIRRWFTGAKPQATYRKAISKFLRSDPRVFLQPQSSFENWFGRMMVALDATLDNKLFLQVWQGTWKSIWCQIVISRSNGALAIKASLHSAEAYENDELRKFMISCSRNLEVTTSFKRDE